MASYWSRVEIVATYPPPRALTTVAFGKATAAMPLLPLAVRVLVCLRAGITYHGVHLDDFQVDIWTNLRSGGQAWASEATLKPVPETAEYIEGGTSPASFAVTFAGELDLTIGADHMRSEFAFRARPSHGSDWTWSGRGPLDNGALYLICCRGEPRSLKEAIDLNNHVILEPVTAVDDVQIGILKYRAEPTVAERADRICRVVGAVRLICLERKSVFWLAPRTQQHGDTGREFLLHLTLLDDSSFLVLLPLPSEKTKSAVCSRGDEVCLITVPNGPISVLAAKGSDVFRLIEVASRAALAQVSAPKEMIAATHASGARRMTESSSIRSDSWCPGPGFCILGSLGWCTWNAFYEKVSLDPILRALDSFADAGTRPAWILLDDGWLQTDEEQKLTSFEADESKFPYGLEAALRIIRKRYPYIRHIGVWHTVWGYWNGISPSSRLAEDFGFVEKATSDGRTIHLVAGDTVRFYDEWYRTLRQSGVDFVKVDGQASFDLLLEKDSLLEHAYRDALAESAQKYMGGNVIYCMAHTPGVLWSCSPRQNGALSNAVLRNSDDFFPNVNESHAWHVYANAANSLFTRSVGWRVLDWDMFQSRHEYAQFHAIARAVSGGAVYLADEVDAHDPSVITPFLATDTSSCVLCSPQPATICGDCLFDDPTTVDVLLKVTNRNSEKLAVVAAFNCQQSSELLGVLKVSDAFFETSLTAEVFAVHDFQNGTVSHLRGLHCKFPAVALAPQNWPSFVPLRLRPRGANVFTFAAVDFPLDASDRQGIPGICCFGLANKYNGSAAVLQTNMDAVGDERFGARYRYGIILVPCSGQVAVYLDFRTFGVPKTAFGRTGVPACVRIVQVNGVDSHLPVMYDQRSSIVFISVPDPSEDNERELQVEVFLG